MPFSCLQIIIDILIGQRHSGGGLHLGGDLGQLLLVDGGNRGSESGSSDEFLKNFHVSKNRTQRATISTKGGGGGTYETGVADELASEPQEGLLEVVVGLSGDIVVLEVLLAVESNRLGLDFALLHVDLVAAEDDRNVLANTDEITW